MSGKETEFETQPGTEQVTKRRRKENSGSNTNSLVSHVVDHDISNAIENSIPDNDQCGSVLKADTTLVQLDAKPIISQDVHKGIIPRVSKRNDNICCRGDNSPAIVDSSCNTTKITMKSIFHVLENDDQVDGDGVSREINTTKTYPSSRIDIEQMALEGPSVQDPQDEILHQKRDTFMKDGSDAPVKFVKPNEDDKFNVREEKIQSTMGIDITSCSKRKLLVLDVNGLLAHVVSGSFLPNDFKAKPDLTIGMKAVFKRPHCDDFLRFCFERFNVGVWSSRTKRNVDSVLKVLLGESKSKLLFCWDQSHCTITGYNTLENQNKPLLLKELKKLWEKHEPSLPWEIGDYDESNTLLLDDSPYKSLKNPPNTAIFPNTYEYTNFEDESLGPRGDLRFYLEQLSSAANVQKFVEQNPHGQQPITESNPSWHFYAKIIEVDTVKREISSRHSDVRHATESLTFSTENTKPTEWSERTVKEHSFTEDVHLTENSEQQSQWDKLPITMHEQQHSKWDTLIVYCCSELELYENNNNIHKEEKAISDTRHYNLPKPNEQNRRFRTKDPVLLLSKEDHWRDRSAGCDTFDTTRDPRFPWIPRSSLERTRQVFRKTKLLILDVNGLLADFVSYVPDGYREDSMLGDIAVFKRPYCDDFLNFCFEKFNIGFWLTTSRRIARSNLDFFLGRAVKDLLFSWDVSHCFETGFSTLEKRDKHIILKELRKVWEKDERNLPWGRDEFDQSNTLLVDNYPYTALLNPPHTAIFPRRYWYKNENTDDSLGPGGDLREFLEGLALAENVQDYVKNNPFGQRPITDKNPSWNYYGRVIENAKAHQKAWSEKWWIPTNTHKKTC